MTTIQALRREIARLAATREKADGPPAFEIWLPRNHRGPERDFCSGSGAVKFFDATLSPRTDQCGPSSVGDMASADSNYVSEGRTNG